MLDGVRRFHEQDAEVKKKFYSRDITKRVFYNTNFNFYKASEVNWRDTLSCLLAPGPLDPHQLPCICRDVTIKYLDHVKKLALTLLELFSEALGLERSYLKDIDCAEGIFMLGHYYPPCPEPELTWGLSSHTDVGFVTILLQDQVGGLQVLYENQWIDVTPIPGAFIINLGDMMQKTLIPKMRIDENVSANAHPQLARSNNEMEMGYTSRILSTKWGHGTDRNHFVPGTKEMEHVKVAVHEMEQYMHGKHEMGTSLMARNGGVAVKVSVLQFPYEHALGESEPARVLTPHGTLVDVFSVDEADSSMEIRRQMLEPYLKRAGFYYAL
ncbi:1-aminocyclopropane-1-carboxylate oxidase homolog 1 [Arachis duranensis]|uniref:1-aminocyclopropane-1-carboxylate oxidase homolog 1 n=1 Tax=Arachis duranensis TaxID=130453 RepID=A0A9C6TVK8_ARADU|nr:1-aminocyclopropane-1-carboxylate oxidase homolog 1 [Arachis duranensis]